MIKLARIVLVNWYAFGVQDVDLRGSTAIIGPNGAGKSSLLDAVQVVLTGNNGNLLSLNASSTVTSGRGRRGQADDARTVFGYCVGRVGGETLRADGCLTYLALVFERERDERRWTVGLGLSARVEDGREDTLGAFIAPDQDLRAADFLHDLPAGGRGPLPWEELLVRLKRSPNFEPFGHRPTMFTRHVLLALRGRAGYAEPDRFLRMIRKALRFQEMSSANDFVRNSLLDDDRLEVESLRASVKAWRGFQEQIERLERQKARLEAAIEQFEELIEKQDGEQRMRWAARRAALDGLDAHLDQLRRRAEAKRLGKEDLERTLERTRGAMEAAKAEMREIEAALATDDRELAIARFTQVELPAARRELSDAVSDRDARLAGLAKGAALGGRLLPLDGGDAFKAAADALSALAARTRATDVDARDLDAVAARAVPALTRYVELLRAARETAAFDAGGLRSELAEAHEQLRGVVAGGIPLRAETRLLRAKLADEGIAARPIAELVEISQERWREAAQTMLGLAREALVVPPVDAQRAIMLLKRDRRDHYGCQVVNTTRTARTDPVPRADSLAAIIATTDPHARAFINTRLNGIVRVSTEEELLRVERGVTADCLSASGGSVEARRPAEGHLLGSDAGERSRPLLEARIATLERDRDRLAGRSKELDELLAGVTAFLTAMTEARSLHELEAAVSAERERVSGIEDNVRTLEGERPQGIRERLADLQCDLEGLTDDEREDSRKRDAAIGEAGAAEARVTDAVDGRVRAAADFDALDRTFEEGARERALRAYETLLAEFADHSAVRKAAEEEATSLSRRTTALLATAPQTARQYAYDFEVPGFELARSAGEHLGWLRDQLARVEENQLVRYRDQAARARNAIEEALRSDLLIKLYTRIEAAKDQIKALNAMLKPRVFHRERYEFEYRPDPAYADIVHVAKRVYEDEADVSGLFAEGAELDGDVARGVARIRRMLEGGDDVTEVSDYRNYLRFELVTRRVEDDVVASEYSRRQQSGSGGEKQVPFYIAMSSAIAATCHHRETDRAHMGLGLALFDEAFNALDGGNVGSCLSLMGEFNLQVIACAPTEKLATFMEHMETVVTINRDRTRAQVDVEYPTEFGRRRFREANPANVPLEEFRALREQAELGHAAE